MKFQSMKGLCIRINPFCGGVEDGGKTAYPDGTSVWRIMHVGVARWTKTVEVEVGGGSGRGRGEM